MRIQYFLMFCTEALAADSEIFIALHRRWWKVEALEQNACLLYDYSSDDFVAPGHVLPFI